MPIPRNMPTGAYRSPQHSMESTISARRLQPAKLGKSDMLLAQMEAEHEEDDAAKAPLLGAAGGAVGVPPATSSGPPPTKTRLTPAKMGKSDALLSQLESAAEQGSQSS